MSKQAQQHLLIFQHIPKKYSGLFEIMEFTPINRYTLTQSSFLILTNAFQ